MNHKIDKAFVGQTSICQGLKFTYMLEIFILIDFQILNLKNILFHFALEFNFSW
jgi:hypothetical protein